MSPQESDKSKFVPGLSWQNLIYFIVGLGAAGIGELSRLPLKEIGVGGLSLLALVFLLRGATAPKKISLQAAENQPETADAKTPKDSIQFTKSLGKNFEVLSNVTGPHGKIEYLVLSKSGRVFVIHGRTRRCKVELSNGELMEDGKPMKKEIMEGLQRNADWVSQQVTTVTGTKPDITPIVVYSDAQITLTNSVHGIALLSQRYLPDFILSTQNKIGKDTPLWVKKGAISRLLLQ